MKRTKKTASVAEKTPRRAKRTGGGSGIRETEEARALLENQLHRLYWWIFNACRIKGFIRAKQIDERATTEDNTQTSGDSPLDQAPGSSDHRDD